MRSLSSGFITNRLLFYFRSSVRQSRRLDNVLLACQYSFGLLRLDQYYWIMKGGERGSMFDAENTEKGRLLTYINLPKEDKMHMPPKNKTQLTEQEQWLLTYWVTSGAYLEPGKSKFLEEKDLKIQCPFIFGGC